MATKYEKFREVILQQDPDEPRAIYAKYQGDEDDPDPNVDNRRKLWPLVLGQDEAGSDVALCYQYGGYSKLPLEAHVSFRNIRCLKLQKMTDVDKEEFDENVEGFDPPILKFKKVRKQNCVDVVDVYRQA